MSGVPNSLRRAGIYHFRRSVPKLLRKVLARSELMCSLRTSDPVLARSRSRRLYLHSEALFGLVRSVPMLDDRQIASLVQSFYAFELEDENRMRLTGVEFDEANRQAAISYFDRLGMDVRQALARNELDKADVWLAALLDREGITPELDSLTRAKLQQGILRASCDVAAAMKKRFQGKWYDTPNDPILLHTESWPDAVQSIGSPEASALEAAVAPAPLFSDRAEDYRQKRIRLKTWDGQTALQARKTYRLFAEVCDDRPITGYTRQDSVRFMRLLRELPSNYGKTPKYRGMKVVEIVDAVKDDLDLDRLSPRTVQRHHSALAALWQDEIEAGVIEDTIFGDFKFPSAKRANEQRDHWPRDKLQKLFESPVWRGCKSEARRSERGDRIIRDERFWVPLIGLFSGMRQEEICQLFLVDIRCESGIWVFDVNNAPPRQIKNATAKRLVPIHRELLRMGLLTRVEELKDAGRDRLFPNLKPGGADGRLGHNFSKWFTRYRKDIGLYERRLDFHSLRHTATTFMEQAGVSRPMVAAIDGHVVPGETSRYMKGFRIEQLKEAIDQLDPQIDLTCLYADQSGRGAAGRS